MSNNSSRTILYSPSQIGTVLRVARERSCQVERRTKRYLSHALGITERRLTNIEEGHSIPPFELAIDWCRIVKDYTALDKIKHIYQVGLPATDPRLLESVPDQLNNLVQQAEGAINAAENLKRMSKDMRPGRSIDEQTRAELMKMAEEILDIKQAAEATLSSLRQNWDLDYEQVVKNWTREAISDYVIIPSVSYFEDLRKEQYFEERARSFGRIQH